MRKRQKTIPKFSSEAAERKFWEVNDSTEYLDLGKGTTRGLPQPQAVDEDHFAAATPALAGRDQGGRQCEGRSVSVAD